MRVLYGVCFFIVVLFVISFHLKNSQDIVVHYYFGFEWIGPLFLILIIGFFLGMIIGVLIMSFYSFKSKRLNNKLRSELVKIEKEVENLRKLPIRDEV